MNKTPRVWKAPACDQVAQGNTKALEGLKLFLEYFQYLPQATTPELEKVRSALIEYQRVANIPQTGEYDEETAAQMEKPRCGMPDKPGLAGFTVATTRWDKFDLTYRFETFCEELTKEQTEITVSTAFDKWAAVSPFTFKRVDQGDVDIRIGWYRRDHHDGAPFDGAGGFEAGVFRNVLAHAFFPPPNGESFAGDVHFDIDETWTVALLKNVALHEIGHSLGLDHSAVQGSVMWPSTNGVTELTSDDIAGMQSIYGPFRPTFRQGDPSQEIGGTSAPDTNLLSAIPRSAPSSAEDPAVRDLLFQSSSGSGHYFPSPRAWEDQQLYFLLPDRFSNGSEDGSLDLDCQPVRGSIKPFISSDIENALYTPGDAKAWEESGTIFQGGTLKGVKSKLGYLRRLGITALWIGPIFKQAPNDKHSYHGYGVQDFMEIDPHFGTREDLCDLVKTAHTQGIFVILDIILNHSGDVFAYRGGQKRWDGRRFDVEGFRDSNGNPTLPFQPLGHHDPPMNLRDCAIWPAELQRSETFTCEGAISNWENKSEYLHGDFFSLKDINLGTGNPDEFSPSSAFLALCEVYKYWIVFADLDGYRIDTVKHMGDAPTRYLCTTLHEFASSVGKDNFFLVGEVTGGRAFEVVNLTGLDAALGIGNVQDKLWNLPKGNVNPAEYFDLFRNATFLDKGTDAWIRNKLVTMIDDHDQVWRSSNQKARFCSDEAGDKLVLTALALNLTTLGTPCIYYGTEQNFDGRGGSDRYIRETMFGGSFGAFRSKERHFFNESNVVFQECAKICKLRQKYAALRRGRQYLREISSNGREFGLPHMIGGRMKSIVAWSRIFADRELLCALNTDTESRTDAFVTIDAGLHAAGESLSCIYAYPAGGANGLPRKVDVLSRNGKAVALSIPPSGFVIYMQVGTDGNS